MEGATVRRLETFAAAHLPSLFKFIIYLHYNACNAQQTAPPARSGAHDTLENSACSSRNDRSTLWEL